MSFGDRTILVLLLSCLFIWACSSTRMLERVPERSLSEVIDGARGLQMDYTWFSAKAKVKFQGQEGSMGGRANIRMIKDSLIWMNFKKLSIEGSRILITRDSFWIVYRLDNLYESGTLQELLEAYDLNLSFTEFQRFIVGNIEVPRLEEVSDFKSSFHYELLLNRPGEQFKYFLNKDYSVSKFLFKDQFNRYLEVNNSSPDKSNFLHDREIIADLGDGNKSKINISLSDVEFNVEKSIPFEIPSHYIRLP